MKREIGHVLLSFRGFIFYGYGEKLKTERKEKKSLPLSLYISPVTLAQ
jgi:hypothetical protein